MHYILSLHGLPIKILSETSDTLHARALRRQTILQLSNPIDYVRSPGNSVVVASSAVKA